MKTHSFERHKIGSRFPIIAVMFMFLFCVMLSLPTHLGALPSKTLTSLPPANTEPAISAPTALNSYPASGQSHYSKSPINFTSTLQNTSAPYNSWSQASCLTTNPDGTTYSNPSVATDSYTGLSPIAADSFQNDTVGGAPQAPWSAVVAGTSTVEASYLRHSMVLHWTHSSDSNWQGQNYTLPTPVSTTATFTYWICMSAMPHSVEWMIKDPLGNYIQTCDAEQGYFYTYPGGVFTSTGCAYNLNQWYCTQMVWYPSTDHYDLYIDSVCYVNNATCMRAATSATLIGMSNYNDNEGSSSIYWDSMSVYNGTIDDSSTQYTSSPVVTVDYTPYIISSIVALIGIALVGGAVAAVKSRHKQSVMVPLMNTQNHSEMPNLNPRPSTIPKEQVQGQVSPQVTAQPPPVQSRQCPRCGLIIESTAKFCEYCGEPNHTT
ncbi:MAG TPA: zinc ribbon domain-containing protein [Candidatus Lokiarchaeia archaeon]|nr:zinc ribbon domain-containing protein [Candidatus Lokiarchaeia archaeon]